MLFQSSFWKFILKVLKCFQAMKYFFRVTGVYCGHFEWPALAWFKVVLILVPVGTWPLNGWSGLVQWWILHWGEARFASHVVFHIESLCIWNILLPCPPITNAAPPTIHTYRRSSLWTYNPSLVSTHLMWTCGHVSVWSLALTPEIFERIWPPLFT